MLLTFKPLFQFKEKKSSEFKNLLSKWLRIRPKIVHINILPNDSVTRLCMGWGGAGTSFSVLWYNEQTSSRSHFLQAFSNSEPSHISLHFIGSNFPMTSHICLLIGPSSRCRRSYIIISGQEITLAPIRTLV